MQILKDFGTGILVTSGILLSVTGLVLLVGFIVSNLWLLLFPIGAGFFWYVGWYFRINGQVKYRK